MSGYRRSNEPVFWALFGAGGVVAALLAPALVFITGLAVPLGVLAPEALAFDRVRAFAGSLVGGVFLFAVVSLLLWHAMHRINHSLHDFGFKAGLAGKGVCYGLALVGTVLAGLQVLRLWQG